MRIYSSKSCCTHYPLSTTHHHHPILHTRLHPCLSVIVLGQPTTLPWLSISHLTRLTLFPWSLLLSPPPPYPLPFIVSPSLPNLSLSFTIYPSLALPILPSPPTTTISACLIISPSPSYPPLPILHSLARSLSVSTSHSSLTLEGHWIESTFVNTNKKSTDKTNQYCVSWPTRNIQVNVMVRKNIWVIQPDRYIN